MAEKAILRHHPSIVHSHENSDHVVAVDRPRRGRALMVAGRPMSAPLRLLHPKARDLVAEFTSRIPPYNTLPDELLDGDITEVTAQCLHLGIRMLDERRLPLDEDLDIIRESAARRAREGVPLESVLAVYHEGIRIVWDLILERAGRDDFADLTHASRLLFSLIERLDVAAATSYTAENRAVTSEDNTATHTLVTELLTGTQPVTVAKQLGLQIAGDYLVIAMALAPHADEQNPDVHSAVAARRKLHRVQTELTENCGSPLLSLLTPQGGTVLVPGKPEWSWARELIRRVACCAEADITATAVQSDLAFVPAASEQAHELLGLARQLRRPPDLYGVDDLALEYQLTRPGPGRDHLATLLRGLDDSPELLQTLVLHIGNDLNRQRTAAQLHLHTNTVDYRMKRIAQLTGLDPTRPSGLRHLQAALVATDFLSAQSPQGT